ncbi:MAG TPA: Spy/CpxP family protein refolding chaperone [Bacteroidota bacterium]|nr:Spy/CpxP family protein refolding chaperone [Bacteroidota bacterium]
MKNSIIIIAALLAMNACKVRDRSAKDLLQDENMQKEIISTIVGSHPLMLKFIEEVKKSDHASMMIDHLLSVVQGRNAEPPAGAGEKGTSPYAGEQSREIKSLSAEEIEKYLTGEGMGLAKAAELNHYPGPRHVMDLANDLHLTNDQKQRTQSAFDAMHEKAVSLGKKIVDGETALDKLFADGSISPERLSAATKDVAGLQGELRDAHLQAHLSMRRILSEEQRKQYDELRGYNSGMLDHSHMR